MKFGKVKKFIGFFLMLAAIGLIPPAPGMAQAADSLSLEDYGSLGGAVDEKAFKAALEAWIKQGNAIIEEYKAMSPDKADKAFMAENSNIVRRVSEGEALDKLDEIVEPVQERWSQDWEVDKLSADDRKVVDLLKKYGLLFEATEGSPFLLVDQPFFNNMVKPYLSPAAAEYVTVKNNHPQFFFSDGGCRYSVGEMGGWAVQWEQFINEHPDHKYKNQAEKQYRVFMEFILFSDLPNTPAFPGHEGGKMQQDWIDGLNSVASKHPGTSTAAIVKEFLTAIKSSGYKLQKTTAQKFKDRIASAFRAAPTPANSQAADKTKGQNPAESRLLGKHLFSLQWIESKKDKYGTAQITRRDDGLYIDARQELNADYATVQGKLTVVSATEFTVEGEIVTRVSYINNGKACPRSGTFTFKATGARKYWRLQQMTNPCDSGGLLLDYVDVFF
jgi:hypothetical protein